MRSGKWLIGILVAVLLLPAVAADEVNYSNILNIDFSTSGDIIMLESSYDPVPAEPGNYVTLWVSIQNWGSNDILDAYFKIKPEFPFYLDPWDNGIQRLGMIGAFQEKLLEFKLKVDESAVEGDNTIDVVWCSDSKCQKEIKTSTLTINVKTGGSPDLLTLLDDSDVLMPGSSGEVTIGLVNKGKLDIRFLTIMLIPESEYEILSPNQIYIGELDSDDSDSASFNLYLDKYADTGDLSLPVKVEYSDSNYKKYVENREIDVRIYSSEDARKMGLVQGGSSMVSVVGFLIIIALAYFGWRWYKKRTKPHKS